MDKSQKKNTCGQLKKSSLVIIKVQIKILKILDYKNDNKQYWRVHCELYTTHTKWNLVQPF